MAPVPARIVYECLSFDTATATCTNAQWVPRQPFPELSVSDAGQLLGAIALVFAVAFGWKKLRRSV